MMKNNKGFGRMLKLIIFLPILMLGGLLVTVGLFQIGEDLFIERIHNATSTAGELIDIQQSWMDTLDDIEVDFEAQKPPFELLFAFLLVIVFSGSIYLAIKSQSLPTISFLGALVFGIVLMLLFTLFVDQFATWFLNELFYKVFDRVDNPLLTWYFANLSIINTVWMALLLLLNQIDISNLSVRKKEGIIEE